MIDNDIKNLYMFLMNGIPIKSFYNDN